MAIRLSPGVTRTMEEIAPMYRPRGFVFRTFGLEWFLGGKGLCRSYVGHADMQGSRFAVRDVGLGRQDLRTRNPQP